MNRKPVILVVDDDVANIEIIDAALGADYELSFATSGADALTLALRILPDLILLDVMMPGIDGYEVCQRLKQDKLLADVPVIFTTGLDDRDAEARGLSLGAIDYVTKPINPVTLRARMRNHIELKQLRDQLAALAVTDALTGLGNRRRLEHVLDAETARLARAGDWLSVVMIDIDFFKRFNDSYGHPAGDHCLTMVAAALNRAARRSTDLVARYGGEEFACVLPAAGLDAAMAVAQEMQARVRKLNIPHGNSPVSDRITLSMGVASARCRPDSLAALWLSEADGQLYLSKAAGRNQIRGLIFEPLQSACTPAIRQPDSRPDAAVAPPGG